MNQHPQAALLLRPFPSGLLALSLASAIDGTESRAGASRAECGDIGQTRDTNPGTEPGIIGSCAVFT